MAVVVKAPNPWQKGKFTLFLSGVIDQDTAPDWQAAVIKALDAYDITILSPRRDDWDSSWEAEIENPKFVEQVAWESRGLSEADYRTFVVFKDSKAPITMLEFGKHIDDPGCLMVEDGFYREGNLEFEAIAHKMPVYYSLEEMITAIRVILDEKGLRLKTAKLLTRRAEKEIESTTEEDAYWAGEGNAASGILAVAKDTHRLCLAWRNQKTHTGDCWGLIGGAVQKEKSPGDSAAAEMREEVGYTGPVELHAGYVFTDQGFSYHNFVGITGSEFPFNPHSDHAWETDFIKWKTLEEWQEEMDTNAGDFHPGVITFFEESADLIASVVGDKRITAKLLTRQAANVKVASPEDLGYLKHYLTMPKRAMGEELARYAPYEFKQYVEQTDPTASGLFDEDEYIDDYTAFDDDILIGFLETFEMHDHVIMDPYAPTFLSVRYDRDIHDEWLVHFSDDAASIAREGFKYGVSDPGRLAVTTNFGKDEKEGGGYNFAFTPDDVFQHEDGRWGKHCVVFKASGIETTHVIDEFTQVIFWGADAHSIVLVSRRNDAWEIRSRDGKKVLFSGELNQAIAWVEKNAVKVLNNAKPVEASAEFALGDRNKAAGGGGRDTESKTAQKKRWPDPTHTSDSLTYQVEDGDEGAFTIWALPSNTAERSQRVGYIEIQVPDDLFGKSAGVLYVLDVAVEDEWRGTGLGQRLYDMAIEKAKSEGARYLTSSADQTPDAKAAWRRLKQRYPVRKKDGLSYIKLSSSQADGSKVATDAPIQDQDVDRTALTETPAFKAWFGNSKVVDDHGRPLVVYHGTGTDFDVFETGNSEMGAHFGNESHAEAIRSTHKPGARTLPCYLSIKKPLRLLDAGHFDCERIAGQLYNLGIISQNDYWAIEEGDDSYDTKWMQGRIKSNGYDGIVYLNRREGFNNKYEFDDFDSMSDSEFKTEYPSSAESWIVFSPSQIKSAIGNAGTFDASNPKITASATAEETTPIIETPAFKAWFGNSKVVDDRGRPLVVYHGADKIRSVFKPEKGTRYTMGTSYEVPMTASFFTPNKSFARSFGKALTPAFLKITKPLDLREGAWGFHDDKAYEILKDHFGDQVGFTPPEELWDILDQPQHTASLRDLGYDGLIFVERDKEGDTHETYAVFDSTQAKSATRNSGAFDASNPKITASAAPTQDADTSATETPAFKAWFAGSKVVDDHGRPLRVFHGTRVAEDFESFDTLNSRDLGSHFGTPEQASFVKDTNENARVIPVYLSIKNPLRLPDLERWDRDSMTEPLRKAGIEIGEEKHQMFYPNGTHTNWERNRMADREQIMETVRQAGYDGIVYSNSFEGGPGKSGDGKDSWIAFKPSQVKSAIGNSGEFSAENNSITAAKTAYLSPKEAELTVTIDRTARHLVAISLDLGIPRFTRFAITIPVQDMPGEEVLEYAHQAFSALVDEVLLFMVSLSYDEQEMVLFTKLVTKCWESLNMEDASDAGMNGSDPVLRMYEASFDIPASFVEETHTRVVTAKSVSRLPNVRKLQLVDVRPDPMDTTPARTIRMFRNRSLKSMPKPFYILVYDQKGRVRGTVPLARNWESRLIKQV